MEDFKKHLDFVRKTIKEDEGLYETYKSTIAIHFQDECRRQKIRFPQLHDVSNNAADNFLSDWIKD